MVDWVIPLKRILILWFCFRLHAVISLRRSLSPKCNGRKLRAHASKLTHMSSHVGVHCLCNTHLHASSCEYSLFAHSYDVTHVKLVNVLPMEKKFLLHRTKQTLPSTPEKQQHNHRSRPPRQTMVLAASVSFPSHGMQQARLKTQMSLSGLNGLFHGDQGFWRARRAGPCRARDRSLWSSASRRQASRETSSGGPLRAVEEGPLSWAPLIAPSSASSLHFQPAWGRRTSCPCATRWYRPRCLWGSPCRKHQA